MVYGFSVKTSKGMEGDGVLVPVSLESNYLNCRIIEKGNGTCKPSAVIGSGLQ